MFGRLHACFLPPSLFSVRLPKSAMLKAASSCRELCRASALRRRVDFPKMGLSEKLGVPYFGVLIIRIYYLGYYMRIPYAIQGYHRPELHKLTSPLRCRCTGERRSNPLSVLGCSGRVLTFGLFGLWYARSTYTHTCTHIHTHIHRRI